MKRVVILIGLLLSATVYSQNIFQEAQNCFDNGNYPCAINHYESILKNADSKQQIKAEIKIIEVKNIIKQLENAQYWLEDEYFNEAKVILQNIIKINPHDPNIKALIEECNQKKAPFLSTTPSNLILSHEKSVKNKIKVITNSKSWRVLKGRTPSWISTTTNSNTLSVSCRSNRKKERVGLIYIKSSDNLEHTIKITQKGKR
tara:strand:- start:4328 stop:4933 length:606 start_codon:yes stop_codon:yes gene_type:complete